MNEMINYLYNYFYMNDILTNFYHYVYKIYNTYGAILGFYSLYELEKMYRYYQ